MENKLPQEIVLSVGKRYPEWQTGQDGYIMEWSETGFVLCAMLNGISQEEKEQFSTQKKLIVRYTVVEDVCYFTFLFGDMPWADCPFSPTLYKTIGENPDMIFRLNGKNGRKMLSKNRLTLRNIISGLIRHILNILMMILP